MPTIVLTFTQPNPAPSMGYVVKYREVGTTSWTYLNPNPSTSPIQIQNLPDGKVWEGTISSQCDSDTFSGETQWTVDDSVTCKTYKVSGGDNISAGAYISYLDCDDQDVTIEVNSGQVIYVCAKAGSFYNNQDPSNLYVNDVHIGCVPNTFNPDLYTVSHPDVSGVCDLTSTTLTRTMDAVNDSVANGFRMRVRVRYRSNSSGQGAYQDLDYIFEIGASEANEHHAVSLSSFGSCALIFNQVIEIDIL